MSYDYLEPFATTDRQRECIALAREYGTPKTAERELGLANDVIGHVLRRLAKVAAKEGKAPGHFDSGVAPGYHMRNVTIQRNAKGEVVQLWERQHPDALDDRLDAIREALGAVPELPPVAPPSDHDERLLTVIPLGDPHFGLLAWGEEVGENFDLAIAEQITFAAIDRLCARTPSSKMAMLLNLGDYFHADDSTNRTPKSSARLDVDGRFGKIAVVAVRAMERCIIRLLEKHERVIVRNNRGNHDPHQAQMLSICMAMRFHDNPRVEIEASPSSFYYYRHGKTLIGSTHGDGAKLNDLPLIMANDVPHEWAQAKWRVWHCGHFHHNQTLSAKDVVGCTVETHRTLAANDAWHRHEGYRSHRDVRAIVYDLELGEIMRLRCGVEELAA